MLKPQIFAAVSILLISILPRSTQAEAPGEWVQLGVEDGITVSRRKMPGDPVLAYKGEGVLNAPLGKLITVSRDTPRQVEWVNRLEVAKVIREITPFDRIIYLKIRSPWPVTDRDFLLESRLEVDRIKKTAIFDVHSIEDPQMPPDKCCVRAVMHSSHVELKALDDARTSISAEAHADPRGALPTWLVNLVQKTFPRKSIEGLLRQVAKPDIKDFFASGA